MVWIESTAHPNHNPVEAMERVIREKCNMPFFHIFKQEKTSSAAIFDDSHIGVSHLAGWECKRVIENYEEIIAASGDDHPATSSLWKSWKEVNHLLQQTDSLNSEEITKFKKGIDDFGRFFKERYA